MEHIDCRSLVLRDDEDNEITDVSDLLVGPVLDHQGDKYRDITLTVPLNHQVQPGKKLSIFNTSTWSTVFSFVSNRIHFQISGECFQRIDARAAVDF